MIEILNLTNDQCENYLVTKQKDVHRCDVHIDNKVMLVLKVMFIYKVMLVLKVMFIYKVMQFVVVEVHHTMQSQFYGMMNSLTKWIWCWWAYFFVIWFDFLLIITINILILSLFISNQYEQTFLLKANFFASKSNFFSSSEQFSSFLLLIFYLKVVNEFELK